MAEVRSFEAKPVTQKTTPSDEHEGTKLRFLLSLQAEWSHWRHQLALQMMGLPRRLVPLQEA